LIGFILGIVPDALVNLKELRYLWIYNTTIVHMTELLSTMTNLESIIVSNCSLTYLPDLSNLHQLWNLDLYQNRMSKLSGVPRIVSLVLSHNLFEEIPRLDQSDLLESLLIENNPLKNTDALMSYPNILDINISSTGSTSIPSTLDKLEKIELLDISNNTLSHLPTNLLNLAHLKYLNIQNNQFPLADVRAFRRTFRKAHPKAKFIS
jgi:Leucine-rich repeat (LRR) protein